MKKFIFKVIIYILPFALTIGPFLFVALRTGEILSYDTIINIQNHSENVIVGMAYNEQRSYYKYANVNEKKVDVIAFGTSRVLPFREEYFETTFYNCGSIVSGNFNEYLYVLENLENLPQVIILGVDQWIFNDNWNKPYEATSFSQLVESDIDEAAIVKTMMLDYAEGKWEFKQVLNGEHNLGLSGVVKGKGYRKDGSYSYADVYRDVKNSSDYGFRGTLQSIEKGTDRFQYADELDVTTIRYFEQLLAYCYEKDIKVIAFTPPFAPTVCKAMDNENYDYMKQIAPTVQVICEQYGYEFYDFTDVSKLGCTDDYFVDGFHGGDIAYGMMVLEMCERKSYLAEIVDEKLLDEMIMHRYSNLCFEMEEN